MPTSFGKWLAESDLTRPPLPDRMLRRPRNFTAMPPYPFGFNS
jgi:hypothetical protein